MLLNCSARDFTGAEEGLEEDWSEGLGGGWSKGSAGPGGLGDWSEGLEGWSKDSEEPGGLGGVSEGLEEPGGLGWSTEETTGTCMRVAVFSSS